jgi:serine O-acetyltransferase
MIGDLQLRELRKVNLMITTKIHLREILAEEKKFYCPKNKKYEWILTSDNSVQIFKYLKTLRKAEYHYNNRKNVLHKLMYFFARRRKNKLGRRLGIEMWENSFDRGLKIWHTGNIVINGKSRIGKNCVLHGNNCIGNSGLSSECPRIGDNVRLGFGAIVIGDVEIANNVTIAAGAVVVNSCLQENAVLAGVPAKCVKIVQD